MDKVPEPTQFPDPEKLADEEDELSWDRERHGHMADFATDDGVVETEDYDAKSDPEADAVLDAEESDALPD